MSYTVSGSALWVTCVCTLQTSEPRIRPGTHRTDEPERSGDRDHHQRGRGYKGDNAHINNSPIPLLWGRKPKSKLFSCDLQCWNMSLHSLTVTVNLHLYPADICIWGRQRTSSEKASSMYRGKTVFHTHPPAPTSQRDESAVRQEKKHTYFIQLQVIEKLPEAVTELHKVPVHRILQLEITQTTNTISHGGIIPFFCYLFSFFF